LTKTNGLNLKECISRL